jgi:hypothetical protein
MNKLSKNEKGFTFVEALLIILILCVIGGVGYMVYHNNHKTATVSTTTKTSTSSSAKSTTETSPYAGWNTYTATLQPVTFRYPKDWTIDESEGNAPINQSDNQFVRIDAPHRSIEGVNYQFSFTFQISTPSGPGAGTPYPVYSSTKLTDTSFPKQLYSLVLLSNAPTGTTSAGQAYSVEVSATSYQSGTNTDGSDTIPTSTSGQEIDMGGAFTQVNDNTLAYFTPSQFASLQEVQQANQIFSSLAQN